MNKISNFFVKIGQGIKKGFFGLINWVKNTAWIQPLLIVGLIFGVILSIKPVTSWVSGLLNPDETYQFFDNHPAKLGKDGKPEDMSTEGTSIIIYYSKETVTDIAKDLDNLEHLNVKYHCIDVTGESYYDDADEIENYKKNLGDCFSQVEDEYNKIIAENNKLYSNTFSETSDSDNYVTFDDDTLSQLPLFVRYDNNKLMGVKYELTDPNGTEKNTKNILTRFFTGTTEDWGKKYPANY